MRYLVIGALVALVVGVSTALGGSAGSSHTKRSLPVRNGVIFGCVETHGNNQTLGDLKLGNCNRGFKPIAWNIRGRPGVRGQNWGIGSSGKNRPKALQQSRYG